MRQGIGILELAQGGRIQVCFCPLTGTPIVDKRDLPAGKLVGFSALNPPQGEATESGEKHRGQVAVSS